MSTLYFKGHPDGSIQTTSPGSSQGTGYAQGDYILILGGNQDTSIIVDTVGAGGSVATWHWDQGDIGRGSGYSVAADVTTFSEQSGAGFLINIDTVGDYHWDNLANWYTNSTGTTPYGGANVPWTVDDVTKGYDLAMVTGETTPPIIPIAAAFGGGFTITITGTCNIGGFDFADAFVYSGTWSGDNLTLSNSSAHIYGGTFTGNYLSATAGVISGGTFSGAYMNLVDTSITGGTFNTAFSLDQSGGSTYIYGGTFNAAVTGTNVRLVIGTSGVWGDGILQGTGSIDGITSFTVEAGGEIAGSLTITYSNDSASNEGTITSGTFNGDYLGNIGVINGGTFNGDYLGNIGVINGGTFVLSGFLNSCKIYNGTFYFLDAIPYCVGNTYGEIDGGTFYGPATFTSTMHSIYNSTWYCDVVLDVDNSQIWMSGNIFKGKLTLPMPAYADGNNVFSGEKASLSLDGFSPTLTMGKGINGSSILGFPG